NNVSANSQSFTAGGGTGAVGVTACMAGGEWSAQSNASWITITSPTTPTVTGNGNVIYAVSANSGSARTGTMNVAGKTFTVTQEGSAATPTPTPSPTPTPNPSPSPSPGANVAQFSQSNYSVQEDCTFLNVTVNRIGDTSGAATVDYATSDV